MNVTQARVYLHRTNRRVAILVTDENGTASAVVSGSGNISWEQMKSAKFHEDYTVISKHPAEAAKVLLNGTRTKDAKSTKALNAISTTEYAIMEAAAPAPATPAKRSKKSAAPATPETAPANGEKPKEKKIRAPKLDAQGNPIKYVKKVYPKVEYKDENVITFVTEPNPKRGASAERFAHYKVGMTIADAIKAGVTRGDIAWDLPRGLIKI